VPLAVEELRWCWPRSPALPGSMLHPECVDGPTESGPGEPLRSRRRIGERTWPWQPPTRALLVVRNLRLFTQTSVKMTRINAEPMSLLQMPPWVPGDGTDQVSVTAARTR
jgi:hypothetical protein